MPEKVSKGKMLFASCIILPHILEINTASGSFTNYYLGHISVLVGLLYVVKNNKMKIQGAEFFQFLLMAVIPLGWFLFQSMQLCSWELFFRSLNFLMFVLTGYYLGAHIRLYLILRILRWFTFVNIISTALWVWMGNVTIVDSLGVGQATFEWLGIYQRINIEEFSMRFAGFAVNPNDFAIWGALGWLGTVIFPMSQKEQRIWLIIAFICLILTQSRAAFMVAIIFYLVYSLFSKTKKVQFIFKAVLVILLGIMIFGKLTDLRGAVLADDWTSGRVSNTQLLYDKFANNDNAHLLGIGMGNIHTLLVNDYDDKTGIDGSVLCVTVENGYLGVLLLFSIILLSSLYALFVCRCCNANILAILLAFYLAMGLYSFFETGIYRNSFIHSIWVAFTFYGLSVRKAGEVS
jgi:hypothetical protein